MKTTGSAGAKPALLRPCKIFQIVLAHSARGDTLGSVGWTIIDSLPKHHARIRPLLFMPESFNISEEEFAQLQRKFSEIKHSINNALAVMMALSEMSQRRPDYADKLAATVLTKAPQIVSSLQEFTNALNDKVGLAPTAAAAEPQ